MSKHAKAAFTGRAGRNMPALNSVLLESRGGNSSFGSPGSPWGGHRRVSSPLPPASIPKSPSISGSPIGGSPSFGRGVSPVLSEVPCVEAPPGWEPFYDPNMGLTYYNHIETGETVWAVDKGWHEVAPEVCFEPHDPASPASSRMRSPASPFSPEVTQAHAFDIISMDEGDATEDQADGWVLGVDRNTRQLYKYHVKTGARRPWVE